MSGGLVTGPRAGGEGGTVAAGQGSEPRSAAQPPPDGRPEETGPATPDRAVGAHERRTLEIKWQWCSGRKIEFDWQPDPAGTGGLVTRLPGVNDFHAESEENARDVIRSLFDLRADALGW